MTKQLLFLSLILTICNGPISFPPPSLLPRYPSALVHPTPIINPSSMAGVALGEDRAKMKWIEIFNEVA